MTMTDNTTPDTDTTEPDEDLAVTAAKALPTTGTSITMNWLEAVAAFGSVLPHTSKDDVTPVITNVNVDVNDGKAQLVATDRYSVGTFPYVPLEGIGLPEKNFMVPRTAAEWISKLTAASLRYGKGNPDFYQVRVTSEAANESTYLNETLVEVLYIGKVEKSQRFDLPAGGSNFPPVARLFTDTFREDAAPAISLNPAGLTKFITSHKFAAEDKDESLRFRFQPTSNPNTPGPVDITVGKFRGLLQPNLMLR